MEFESLKGFRDFYPEEMSARREVFDTVEETARRYGFREIATPSLESLELFEVKSGEEIVEETYSFEDKGGRRVTMTPELTPSVARMFVARQQEMSKPVKWFSVPKLWRYEQPQSGRLREFYQPNFDVFGSEDAAADAEVIALAHDVLTQLGLGGEFVFRLSHRKIAQGVVERFDLAEDDETQVHRVIDKSERLDEGEVSDRLDKIGLENEEIDEVVSLTRLGSRLGGANDFDEVIDSVLEHAGGDEKTREGAEELREVTEKLDDHGLLDDCVFDPSIVRGLDYYTGTVFECFDTEGDLRAIFGGGRYDDLVESFGGQPTPAVGFGMGDATLELLMKRADVWPSESLTTDYYVAVVGDVRSTAVDVARGLREDGNVVELDVTDRSFSAQLEHADKLNAEKTVIVGERDLEEGVVTVKEMESGDQEKVPPEELV